MLIAERAQQAIPHLSEMHGVWVYDIVLYASVHVPGVQTVVNFRGKSFCTLMSNHKIHKILSHNFGAIWYSVPGVG